MTQPATRVTPKSTAEVAPATAPKAKDAKVVAPLAATKTKAPAPTKPPETQARAR
jgi:hypothetical protein